MDKQEFDFFEALFSLVFEIASGSEIGMKSLGYRISMTSAPDLVLALRLQAYCPCAGSL